MGDDFHPPYNFEVLLMIPSEWILLLKHEKAT